MSDDRQHQSTSVIKPVEVCEVDGRPQISIQISGYKTKALIDTGASRSLLHAKVYDRVLQSTHRHGLLATTAPLQSVSGHDLKVKGTTQVKIDNVGPMAVHVVENMPHDLLIGTDMLKKGSCVIDYPHKPLHGLKRNGHLK